METDETLAELGLFVVRVLAKRGADYGDRLTEIVAEIDRLELGRPNHTATEDTDPWIEIKSENQELRE